MRIKVIDWNIFKKTNAINFTNDDTIKKEYEVYAFVRIKNKRYVLLYLDFFKHKFLSFILLNEALIFVDDTLDEKFVYRNAIISEKIIESDGLNFWKDKCLLKDVYAPLWMIEDKEFFIDIWSDRKNATIKFLNHLE